MAYKYDIFFSYKRHHLTDYWHDKLVQQLKFWLDQELPDTNVEIFFDKETIEIGDLWRDKIGNALKKSKCLVAIMSPNYFKSKWCYAELLSFMKRQELYKDRATAFVLGASFHDGESFPKEVKAIQSVDFSKYAQTTPAFWETRGAAEFEEEIKKFAQQIARKLEKAPSFSNDFPVIIPDDDDLLDTSITSLV